MNTNKFFIIPFLLFLLIFFIKLPLFAPIIIEGKKADVELNDLLLSRKKVNNETDVKKLCVEITERYHSNGYTAFKIINAVIKKDGTLHLNFSDPM
jgi:outer membrane protein assembly factor BamA